VEAQTDAAIRFMQDAREGQPFSLFTSYLVPHHQNYRDNYPAPDGCRERHTGHRTPPDLAAFALAESGAVDPVERGQLDRPEPSAAAASRATPSSVRSSVARLILA